MKYLLILVIFIFISFKTFSQGCCSGGSGSPIAGGISQGVLMDGQMELATNYQYANSAKFYTGDIETKSLTVNNLVSNYLYSRIAYGVTSKLTFSIEAGYYFNKTQIGQDPTAIDNKWQSSGISDLIIFPRYDIFDKTDEKYHTEITLGLGMKIPIGKYNDSTFAGSIVMPPAPMNIYIVSPPTVQPTTGSNDFIFYGFALREYKKRKFKIFANAIYMHKGYNPLGEKFGDYASIGLFAGKTFFRKLGITFQLKYEQIGKMQAANNIDLLAKYNVDVNSTGSQKLSFVPQLNYSYKSFTVFVLTDIPIYQYLNGSQIGSQYLITSGITYRFMPFKKLWKKVE